MDTATKYEEVRKRVNSEKRVIVDFVDEKDIDAQIRKCTSDYVELELQQHTFKIPLRAVEVVESGRLKLVISLDRPQHV